MSLSADALYKMFTGSSGGVTERNMAIDVSEEIARKGQELREMTRDLDLLKVDVDIIAIVIRSRGDAPLSRSEARRQSLAVAASSRAHEDQAFIDAVSTSIDEADGHE